MNQSPIAFIGLGQMGAPMALNLLKAGFSVCGYDRDITIAKRFCDAPSFTWGATAADTVLNASMAVLMLPDSSIVDALLWEGDQPISKMMAPGSLLIDMSSSDPMHSHHNAQKLKSIGIGFIDAPVSGGVKKAEAGTLAIMMGGETALIDKARPVLSAMGTTLTYVGNEGSGHAVKALNNYVSAAGLLAVSEALCAAVKFGVDPHVVNQVFNASTAKNNTTENKVEAYMLSSTYNSGFALSLMKKDLETANRFMEQVNASSNFSAKCLEIWQSGDQFLGKGADHTAMYEFIKKRNVG
jgi:3-hydroxyisobutyrate dehydrogenase